MLQPVGARKLILGIVTALSVCGGAAAAAAQEPVSPPAYLAVVEGTATLARDGDVFPAVRDMPFVSGDRLRTENGRVEIDFPDGTAIEVGSYSEVEALSDTRVRLVAGTMDHLPRRPVASASTSYLPTDLRNYGPTFDQYGSWNYDASYGYVWYPSVAAGWRPYYYGSWASVRSYGWTWVGLDAWSWPTHHYGRWGFARNAWFWIPGRTWSAAWVSWGVAPDYVSWCPLGYDGHPVFALNPGAAARTGRGWTVVSRDHFGYRGHYAHRDAIDPHRFDARTPFVQTTRLPVAFGRDRDKVGSVTSGPTPAIGTRTAPSRNGVTPPVSAGVIVAVPRGSAAGASNRDSNIGPRDPKSGTREPRIPMRGSIGDDRQPTTGNPYFRAVPPAPRAVGPVVPSVSTPVVPPAGKAVIAPVAPAAGAGGRIEGPVPGNANRPAPIKVEPLRAPPPVTGERVAGPPPPPPPPSPSTQSRGAGAPTGKTAGAPAKRPR